MNKEVKRYADLYEKQLRRDNYPDIAEKKKRYSERLQQMYDSKIYKEHNIYPTMNVNLIYAVIAVCLELKELGLDNKQIMDFSDGVFRKRKKLFAILEELIDILPNSYKIAEKWNIDDHEKRVKDGSITYDMFKVEDGRIEYNISECMYVKMFEYYGIRPLCKIFCKTDESAYALLKRRINFTRYSDLSDGDCCHDVITKK